MSDLRPTSYDEVPYGSGAFVQTHPDTLATVATLLGARPPRVEGCRVLELGCASGGNLLPMTQSLPGATFVGVDLSGRQVEEGRQVVRALGLTNVTLEHRSILDVGRDLGLFDYVICHGVYSWVPRRVQDRILAVCAENLAPDGVTYVSYNVYPGWHARGLVRTMACYYTRHLARPLERVRQARGVLEALARALPPSGHLYGPLLREERELARKGSDAYFFHEYLEEFNEPLYFFQFAGRARAWGLRYLGEVDLGRLPPAQFPPEVEALLRDLPPDPLHREQAVDFLRHRAFRQSLLCHGHVTADGAPRPERVAGLLAASPARPAAAHPDLHSEGPAVFEGAGGEKLSVPPRWGRRRCYT
jgi:SAM-dependent methyltransferase